MSHPAEILLSVVPGATDNDRLLLVLRQQFGDGTQLELRQQSWADGIGWFTQSSVSIHPEQLDSVRAALGKGQTKRSNFGNRSSFPAYPNRHNSVAAESA